MNKGKTMRQNKLNSLILKSNRARTSMWNRH